MISIHFSHVSIDLHAFLSSLIDSIYATDDHVFIDSHVFICFLRCVCTSNDFGAFRQTCFDFMIAVYFWDFVWFSWTWWLNFCIYIALHMNSMKCSWMSVDFQTTFFDCWVSADLDWSSLILIVCKWIASICINSCPFLVHLIVFHHLSLVHFDVLMRHSFIPLDDYQNGPTFVYYSCQLYMSSVNRCDVIDSIDSIDCHILL